MRSVSSWGNYPVVEQSVHALAWRDEHLPVTEGHTLLAHGQGRSYGDVALNAGGTVLTTTRLDRFLSFDTAHGVLCAEAGVTLAQILKVIVPHGWFLPVTPGTRFVSLGGAVANDVHGKNHHQAGTFGNYVQRLALRRSNGELLICTPTQNRDMFRATIGGLGLTGLIVWVEFSLKKIHSTCIEQETVRFANLAEFHELSAASAADWEYTVAWVDCLASGNQLGRGIFFRGRHAAADASLDKTPAADKPRLAVPFNLPGWLLNRQSVRLFNSLYYNKPRKPASRVHFEPFFYPLDKLASWNRLYGRRGFFQYQCVLPHSAGQEAMREILTTIADSGQGSFLSVLKVFGEVPSPGMLSFPRPGTTLALDFANHGSKTRKLFAQLDQITVKYNGAVYPAKDACMSAASYQHYYPQWREFSQFIDPAFSSSFWRRVTNPDVTA